MNKLAKLVFAASAVVAFSAQAQTDIKAAPLTVLTLNRLTALSFVTRPVCAGVPVTGPLLMQFQVATVL
jgi:hypothetical protein